MTTETVLSLAALIVALIALYRSSFHRGSVRMTQPTPILFSRGPRGLPRVSMMTVLFTTGSQGHVLESLYVVLRRGGTEVTFPQWSYAEANKAASAGLYVPPAGIPLNHEFIGAPDSVGYQFLQGTYTLDVFVSIITSRGPRTHLDRSTITLGQESSSIETGHGVIFTWLPSEGRYVAEEYHDPRVNG